MIPVYQRFISILFYLIPCQNIIQYGHYIYNIFPIDYALKLLVMPVIIIENSFPVGGFWLFLLLFLGIARNPRISYFIRFNTMQAILLTLSIVIINYLYALIINIFNSELIAISIATVIFIGILTSILFAFIQCLRGVHPDLPFFSDAAKMQI